MRQWTLETANLALALMQVQQAFHDNDATHGSAPWIPGVDAPRVLTIIENALAAAPACDLCGAVGPHASFCADKN